MNYLSKYDNRSNRCSTPSRLTGLDKQIESLFAGFPSVFQFDESPFFKTSPSASVPSRWYENDDAYLVRLDLPGLNSSDIEIEFRDEALSISATRTFSSDAGEDEAENRSVEYRKVFEVPEGVDESKFSAAYESGVLSVTLPKSERARPRKIEVR